MEEGHCQVCGAPSALICQRCFDSYCSVRCQAADWQRHRAICFPMPHLVDRSSIIPESNIQTSQSMQSVQNKRTNGPKSTNTLDDKSKTSDLSKKDANHVQQSQNRASVKELSGEVKPARTLQQRLERKHFLEDNKENDAKKNEEPCFKSDISAASKTENTIVNEVIGVPESMPKPSANVRSLLMKAKLSGVTTKKEPWMHHVPLPKQFEITEVVVSSFDTSVNSGFVMLAKDYDICMRLLRDLNKAAVKEQPSLNSDEINMNELYAVINTDQITYRGVVISKEAKAYRVKLIDFGDEIILKADKLKPVTAVFRERPAYAIPVVFKNNDKPLNVEQRLKVKFIDIGEKSNTVEIVNETKPVGLVSWLAMKDFTKLNALLRYVLSEKAMIIAIKMPDKFEKLYEVLNNELQETVETLETTKKVEIGMMIAIKRADQQYSRGFVLAVDYTANTCVVYLCDYGTFETLIPIPEKAKICSEKIQKIQNKAVFLKINEIVLKDQFAQKFLKADCTYNLDVTLQDEKIFVDVSLNGVLFVKGQIFDMIPNYFDLGLNYWTIQSPTQTYVALLRTAADTKVRAMICPVDKHEIFNSAIQSISSELSPLTKVPTQGEIVLYTLPNQTLRCIVRKIISDKMVDIRDIDGGNNFQCDWKKLQSATDFIRSLPVYTMSIVISDCGDLQNYDIEEVKQYIDEPQLKKREYMLSYDGSILSGATLITNLKTGETFGTLLKSHIENLKSERIETRKREEEALRKAELEEKQRKEEAQRKSEEEARKEAEKEENQRKKEAQRILEEQAQLKALEEAKSTVKEEGLDKKFFIDNIATIPLTVGKVCKLILVDVNRESGLVAVCEDKPENAEFLMEILHLCEHYMNTSEAKSNIGYEPQATEMCLALFEDGSWYRATCLDAENLKFTMHLVDFGTIMEATPDKLIKFPEALKGFPIRTHFAIGLPSEVIATLEPYSKKKCLIESFEDSIYTIKSS